MNCVQREFARALLFTAKNQCSILSIARHAHLYLSDSAGSLHSIFTFLVSDVCPRFNCGEWPVCASCFGIAGAQPHIDLFELFKMRFIKYVLPLKFLFLFQTQLTHRILLE